MSKSLSFSLMFFSGGEGESAIHSYDAIKCLTQQADKAGFRRVWLPERHFVPFGALHPAPAVLASHLAACTQHIRLAAGSVVAPLHPAKRVVEDWSVVDNLSRGRVDLSLASGWLKSDFEYAPDSYENRHSILREKYAQIAQIWENSGKTEHAPQVVAVGERIYPAPVQSRVPLWLTAARNTKTFELAGSLGANVLTYLVDLGVEQLANAITAYKAARQKANFDPGQGQVTVMLHSLLAGSSGGNVQSARHYYSQYLFNNYALLEQSGRSRQLITADVVQEMVDAQFERVYEKLSLMGSHSAAHGLLNVLTDIGVTEVACLVDFVDNPALVSEAMEQLLILKDTYGRECGE